MDFDSFILSYRTQNIINDSRSLQNLFDSSNLHVNHELFNNKNKRVVGKITNETLEKNWEDEFKAMRSRAFSFKCNDKNKNKLKSFPKSQAKHSKFEKF